MQRVAVVGGAGVLGRAVVTVFKRAGWHVASIDRVKVNEADENHVNTFSLPRLKNRVHVLNEDVDVIVAAAGAFAGGGVGDDDVLEVAQQMYEANVGSALLASHLAATQLRPRGLLVLTGAELPAKGGVCFAAAYGACKGAVHQLVHTVADEGTIVGDAVCILPGMIDTPANREGMPDADRSTWTAPEDVAEQLLQWSEQEVKRPASGSFARVVTVDGKTTFPILPKGTLAID